MSEARPLALGLGGGSAAALLEPVAFEARLEQARGRRADVLAPKREVAAAIALRAPAVWREPLRLLLLLAGLGTGAALASLLLMMLPPASPVPTAATSFAMLAPLSGPAIDGLPPASLVVPTAATSPAMLAPLSAPALDGLPPPALWAGWIGGLATPPPTLAAVEAVLVLPPRTVVRPSGMRMNAAAAHGAVFCILVDNGSIVRASPDTQSPSDGPTVVWFLPARRSGVPIDPLRTSPSPGRLPIGPTVTRGGIPAPSDYEISERPAVASPLRPDQPSLAPGYEIPDKPRASPGYEPPRYPPAASHPDRPIGGGVGARPDHPSSGAPGSSGGVSNRVRDADHQARSTRKGRETSPGGGKASSDQGSSGKGSSANGSSAKGSSGKGSAGKGSAGKGSSGKGSSGKGSSGKGSSGKDSSGKGSSGKGSSDKGSSGRGGSGKGGRG